MLTTIRYRQVQKCHPLKQIMDEILAWDLNSGRKKKETKVALGKAQEDIKKYADRHRGEAEEYQVGDLVLLSTKDLKYQMVRRRTEKLTKRFVRPDRVKSIVLTNTLELELPSTVKIHPVVNVSRVQRYTRQVKGQRKEMPQPVVIKGEEEWEVEKIMNKR